MEKVYCSFTVLFEDPFWVGVYERSEGGRLTVCKLTFGAEPREGEVLALLLDRWRSLRFSPAVAGALPREAPKNPKRARREQQALLEAGRGIGTRAQQALQLQREQSRTRRIEQTRASREEEKERRFLLRQQKRKEKHRGG